MPFHSVLPLSSRLLSRDLRLPAAWKVALLPLAFSAAALAQSTTGSVSGTIQDPAGASVSGAKITITNVDTHGTVSTTSNGSGNYIFPALQPGRYEVTCSDAGFATQRQPDILVDVNGNARVSFSLTAGSVEQSIVVQAETSQIDATSSELGQTIDQKQIQDLPLNGRSAYGLVLLSPGVTNYSGTAATGSYNGVLFSVNGRRNNDNSFYLDGAYNTSFFRNSGNLIPNPDALQEFRVLTSNFDAEFGRLPGAVVNVITRSGTNAYHGLVYNYLRNDALNAQQKFVNGVSPLKQNQFGANLGGPILRNRDFFFLSYEGIRIASPVFVTSSSVVLPTPAMATGDFRGSGAARYPRMANGSVYSCNGVQGVICPALLDPVAQNILRLVPKADAGTGVSPQQVTSGNSSANQGFARFDAQATASHKLSLSTFFHRGFSLTPTAGGNTILSYSGTNQSNGVTNLILNDSWIVSPSKLNNLNVSFSLNHSVIGNIFDRYYLSDLGSRINEGAKLRTQPQVAITGFFTAGSGSSSNDDKTQQSIAVFDNFLWTHGNHQLKMGGSFVWKKYHDTGVFAGSTAASFTGTVTGNAFADFLLGNAASFRQNTGTYFRMHGTEPALYAQDSWRMTHRMTVNVGLRYEIYSPMTADHTFGTFVPGARSSRFPTAPVGLLFSDDPGIPNGILRTQYLNFAPRAGFAFDTFGTGRTVLRGGFGLFYEGLQTGINQNLQQQPYALDLTVSRTPNLVTPYGSTADPFPYIVSPTNPVFQSGASIAAIPANGNSRTPYVQEYNLNVEQQLPARWQSQVAYVGSSGRRGYVVRDANAPVYAPGAATNTAGINNRRPYQPTPSQYVFAGVYELAPVGNASYNALQVTLNRRFQNSFSVLVNYTWQKAIDIASADVASISGTQLVDDNNLLRDRGISSINVPHIFVASGSYALPPLRRLGLLGHSLLGGWQLNALAQMRSGGPINILSGVDSNLNGTNNDRPNQVGNPNLSGGRSQDEKIAQYFNTAAFAAVPAGTPYGNVARNSLTGPGYANVDFSAFKNIALWHEHNLQIRGEFFNLFDRVNLGNPNAVRTSAQFGKITSAGSPRIIQVAARYSF